MIKTEHLHEQHPDRAGIHAEAHARPPVAIASETSESWHWVLQEPQGDPGNWPKEFDPDSRHQIVERPDGLLRFERHTEFVSLTFFGQTAPRDATLELIKSCPGRQLAGARIITAEEPPFDDFFGRNRVFGGQAMFDGIHISTDFQVGDFELVHYSVSGNFDDAFSRGRLVKRLLDLETYRVASLLGLPVIRRLIPKLEMLEARADQATRSLDEDSDDLNDAIHELADILKRISIIRNEVHFRMAASTAYYDLVTDRLDSLDEKPVGQRQTLRGFVKHRLDPGMKSIWAFERRAQNVTSSISEALALVRTQLDHVAQQQSQDLLASMEQRARQQVYLAQAVEGLSVAAITYYAVGLLGYMLKGIPDIAIADDAFVAISIIPIATIVALATRRARRRISKMVEN